VKREIRQPRSCGAVPIDRVNNKLGVLKNSSYATICTPPVRKWGVFEEETEGTFRRKIEAGDSKHPTIQTVAGIAKALGVSLDDLARECSKDT